MSADTHTQLQQTQRGVTQRCMHTLTIQYSFIYIHIEKPKGTKVLTMIQRLSIIHYRSGTVRM